MRASGITDSRAGLPAAASFEGYVHRDDLQRVVRRHLLVEPVNVRANVWLHASDFVPVRALRLQVAAHLADHGSPRERTRARELVLETVDGPDR